MWVFGMNRVLSADCHGACERSTMRVQLGLATVCLFDGSARHCSGKLRESNQCGHQGLTDVIAKLRFLE